MLIVAARDAERGDCIRAFLWRVGAFYALLQGLEGHGPAQLSVSTVAIPSLGRRIGIDSLSTVDKTCGLCVESRSWMRGKA